LIGRRGAMKPGGKVREVSDIRGDWNRRRSRGGQIRGELSAASAFSLKLRRFRRAQCKRPDPPTHSTGRDLPPAPRVKVGAGDQSSFSTTLREFRYLLVGMQPTAPLRGRMRLKRFSRPTRRTVSLQSVGNLWASTASDIEGPTDLDWVGLCFEAEISRGALDSCMAQERSNCL
jgi:hypothetical protein